MTDPTWHRVLKEHGRAVLGRKDKEPGKGVWVANVLGRSEVGHSIEAVAKDGVILKKFDCWCGYDRHVAWKFAESVLFGREAEGVAGAPIKTRQTQ